MLKGHHFKGKFSFISLLHIFHQCGDRDSAGCATFALDTSIVNIWGHED